jgi:hypothetical protein
MEAAKPTLLDALDDSAGGVDERRDLLGRGKGAQ